jgi:2-methylcitrate dehydratase PrpD
MPTTTEATSRMVDYVLATTPDSLPASVRREALRSFVNIVGCTVGGSRHDAVAMTEAALLPFAGEAQATLVGRGRKCDILTASLINCLSSSVYTFDDTHAEAIVHPSGPVMAAVLALAERRQVRGRDLLTAFALGVEIVCRLSKAISVAPAKGSIAWSQTGITCGIGTAVAAGKLLQLDARAMRRAVGIAASQAAGIRAMHGTICTAMMPAHASQVGLRAAILAQAGITSSERSIEGKYGFAECFAQEPALSVLAGEFGERFEILGNTYKPYPCGIVIHPMIDGCLQLKAETSLDAHTIDKVHIRANPTALALCDRRQPKDEFEGQVSLYQWVAASLLRGKAGVAEGTDAAIAATDIAALRERIVAVADASIAPDAAHITITLRDGATLEKQVLHCIGSKNRPMTDREIDEKFKGLAEGSLTPAKIKVLIAACWSLETLADAADVVRAAA